MKRAQSELLNTQGIAGDDQNKENSGELLERHEVPGSPFTIVGNKEQGYFLTMGKYRLTDAYQDVDGVIWGLENEKWEIIFNLIITLIKSTEELRNLENK